MPGVLRPAARGSYEGALAWLTFGLLEHLCLSVLPAWRESSLLLTPASRLGALAALLAAYTLFGALAGAVAGAAFPARAAGAGPATVVLAWIPHLVAARGFSRSAHLALAVAVLLLAVLALRAWRPRPAWDRLTAWLASPAGVSLCLLAPLVFRDQLHLSPLAARLGPAASAFKAIVAAAGTLLLILLLAAGARAWSSRRRPARAWLRLATPFVLGAAILSGAWLLDARALGRVAEPGRAPGGAGAGGVLLISLDAVRADHLSAYGYRYPTSPALAALAEHATVYLDARAASDMSLGAHASLFTGTYPGRHGAWVGGAFPFGRPLAPSVRTLAERLGDAGWVRFASVANGYFLNRAYGLSRGFQLFDVPAEDRLELRSRVRGLIARLSGGAAPVNRPAREVNGVLLAGLEAARAGGRPFLAFANYMEAHAPYAPRPALTDPFPGYDPSLPARAGPFVGAEGTRRVVDPRERGHFVSLYDGGIAALDRELGALFDRLRSLGLFDPALIVVVADHGEMLGERGIFGHGAGLVDEVLHVPLIVKYPFQREGRRVPEPVSQVDIVPTVLDALRLRPDPSLDGISLLSAEPSRGRVVLAEAPPYRSVYDGRAARLERMEGVPGAGPSDADGLDRLKSLGYVR